MSMLTDEWVTVERSRLHTATRRACRAMALQFITDFEEEPEVETVCSQYVTQAMTVFKDEFKETDSYNFV